MRAEVPSTGGRQPTRAKFVSKVSFAQEGLAERESCGASLRSAQVSMTRRATCARWFISRFAPSEVAVASALATVSVMRRAGGVGLEDYPTTD